MANDDSTKRSSHLRSSNSKQTKRVLTEKEASAYISMSASWLRQARIEGSRSGYVPPLPFIKIGRSVRYFIEDLDAWLEKFQKLEHLAQLAQSKTKI